VPAAQTDRARRAFRQCPGRDCHRRVAVPADRCQLPPDLHAPHMQRPLVCNVSSRHPDAGPVCVTAARLPATSRSALPTSRHAGAADQPPPPRVAHAPHRPILIPSSYHTATQSHFPSSPLASPLPLAATRATIAAVPWPPSTAAPGAPLAPSTPPVASPELGVALHPHQSSQPQPADHLTGTPLRPIDIVAGSPPR
jgi:hypothetical protein